MSGHIPVLLSAVEGAFRQLPKGCVVDATFGGGGYSRALLARPDFTVLGIDRDPEAVVRGAALAAAQPRFRMAQGAFGDLAQLVSTHTASRSPVVGAVFDLGLSSFQLDSAERGFSFRFDGPLDMRMGAQGATAADLVNTAEPGELARILKVYGEEPRAGRVVRAIVRRRELEPFERTGDFADVVRRALGGQRGRTDPATRTFQGLRIAVNDELGELERGLQAALEVLAVGGKLAVVSFHSLEDRIVKRFFQDQSGYVPGVSRHQPAPAAAAPGRLAVLTRRVIKPDEAEIAANPRARSARLRVAEKVAP